MFSQPSYLQKGLVFNALGTVHFDASYPFVDNSFGFFGLLLEFAMILLAMSTLLVLSHGSEVSKTAHRTDTAISI